MVNWPRAATAKNNEPIAKTGAGMNRNLPASHSPKSSSTLWLALLTLLLPPIALAQAGADQVRARRRFHAGAARAHAQPPAPANGTTTLTHQGDGNVVVRKSNRVLFQTNTAGQGSAALIMQADGNLVLYSRTGSTAWRRSRARARPRRIRPSLVGVPVTADYFHDENLTTLGRRVRPQSAARSCIEGRLPSR